MRESQFQSEAPGRLVPTEFKERGPDGSSRTTHGLAFVPVPLPPKLDRRGTLGQIFDVHDRATKALLRLEGRIDALPGRTVLLAAMRLRESQASSKIENIFATIKEIAVASANEARVPGDAAGVARNRRAIEQGLASALPISTRLLCDMHRTLISNPSKRPGRLRDEQVCIGDENDGIENARFVPPPPSEVEGCMRDWELFCNPRALNAPKRESWPFLVELAFSHYQFETIHPFSDGNGRLGRALITLTPVKDGHIQHPVCNFSEWVHEHRQEYYDSLLRVSTHGAWEDWIRFFCTAIAEQAELDSQRAGRVAALYEKYAAKITTRQSSVLVTRLLDHVFEWQTLTVPQAAKVMNITYPAAQRHVDRFVREGILKPLDAQTYAKMYYAPAVIRAIQGRGEP